MYKSLLLSCYVFTLAYSVLAHFHTDVCLFPGTSSAVFTLVLSIKYCLDSHQFMEFVKT